MAPRTSKKFIAFGFVSWTAASVSWAALSHADDLDSPEKLPGDNESALPGVIHLALPTPETAPVVLAASAGAGFYGQYLGLEGGSQKYLGSLAASWSPIRYLSLRGQLNGSIDVASAPANSPTAYGEPVLAIRALYPALPALHLGFEAELEFVGGVAPDISPGAWTPTLRALGAYQIASQTWLAADLGFRFDNSSNALSDAVASGRKIDDGILLLSGASSYSQLELGLGATHRWGDVELLGEFMLNALVGSGSPGLGQSPMNLAAGARYHYSESLVFRGQLELSPSALPDTLPAGTYVPIRPRFAIGLGAQWRFGVTSEKAAPLPAKPVAVAKAKPAPKKPDSGRLAGRVVDEGGRPIPDAKVILEREGQEPIEYHTDADGRYVFEEVPYGAAKLTTETPGFDPVKKDVTIDSASNDVPESILYESVPVGQLRGKVLDMRGEMVRAEVTINPGNRSVEVDAEGSFSVDLAPGTYQVQFKHAGYRSQMRHIRVQDKGVVVVNIALEK